MSKPIYEASAWGNRFHNLTCREALGAGAAGPGKALALDTPIWTTEGLKTMGDLRIGDAVFGADGQATTVLWASPVMEGHRCYRVTFDDGSMIVADAEHLWETLDYNERASLRRMEKRSHRRTGANDQRHKRRLPRVRTTEEIAATLRYRGRVNHVVLNGAALQFWDNELPLEPYLLGIWLGDGTKELKYGFSVTTVDPEIVDLLEATADAAGLRVRVTRGSTGAPTYHLGGKRGKTNPLVAKLRELLPDAPNSIKIPPSYLTTLMPQRMRLLQGIVDSDGHVDRDGRVEICVCDSGLAADIYRLVCGLGFKATHSESASKLYGRTVGRRHRICFSPQGREVARLPRKVAAIGAGSRTQRWRYIVAADEVEPVPVRCIFVDNERHLYLAGESCVPTHNTTILLADALPQIYVEHERCTNKDHPDKFAPGESTGWALHLRRTVKMLEQTIVKSHRLFPAVDPGAKWDATKTTWTFTSGYRYQFGHCKDSLSWNDYFSAEYTWIGFDELVQFEEEQYQQVSSRCRSSDHVLMRMLKVRAMSNPMQRHEGDDFTFRGDPMWVRNYFVEPAPEGGKLLTKKVVLEDGTIEKRQRIYLPARLSDNPDKVFVREYEATLRTMKPHQQQALLHGNWWITAGSYFGDSWNERLHVIEPFKIPPSWPVARSMDWGFKKPGCIHWGALDEDDNLVVFRELTFKEKTDVEVAKEMKLIEQDLGLWKNGKSMCMGVADAQLWEKRGDKAKSKAAVFQAKGIKWKPADRRSRRNNAERIDKRLKDHDSGTKMPGLVIFRTCRKLIQTLPAIQTDKDGETPQDGGPDHWFDSLCYLTAFASHGRAGFGRSPIDQEDDDRFVDNGKDRGRDGYGSQL